MPRCGRRATLRVALTLLLSSLHLPLASCSRPDAVQAVVLAPGGQQARLHAALPSRRSEKEAGLHGLAAQDVRRRGGLVPLGAAAGCCAPSTDLAPGQNTSAAAGALRVELHSPSTDLQCQELCERDAACVAVNVGPVGASGAEAVCQLLLGNRSALSTDCPALTGASAGRRCFAKPVVADEAREVGLLPHTKAADGGSSSGGGSQVAAQNLAGPNGSRPDVLAARANESSPGTPALQSASPHALVAPTNRSSQDPAARTDAAPKALGTPVAVAANGSASNLTVATNGAADASGRGGTADVTRRNLHTLPPTEKDGGTPIPPNKLQDAEATAAPHPNGLPNATQHEQLSADAAANVVRVSIRELMETLNVASGGKENVQGTEEFTPKDIQRMRENSSNDDVNLIICFAFNATVFTMACLLFCYWRQHKPEILCPKPTSAPLWWKADDATDDRMLTLAGLDGLMFVKFLRFGVKLTLLVASFNVMVLCPAHWYLAPLQEFLKIPAFGGSGCSLGGAITDEKECERAIQVLHMQGKWAYAPGQCFASQTSKDKVGALICKNAKYSVINRLSIQGVGTMTATSLLPWLHTAGVLFTTAVMLWLLSRLLGEFAVRRRQYMLTTPARTTVFVRRIPGDVKGGGLRDFFEQLYPDGRVQTAFHVQRPPQELWDSRASPIARAAVMARYATSTIDQDDSPDTEDWEYTPCGFVTFTDVRDAHDSAQVSLSSELYSWLVHLAPEPTELLWANIFARSRPCCLFLRQALAVSLFWLLFFFWFIPVALFSTMANNKILEGMSLFKDYVEPLRDNYSLIYHAADGNLSAAWMAMFMSGLPMLMAGINYLYGFPLKRLVNSAVERQYFRFCIFYVILVNAMTQSCIKFVQQLIEHPTDIFNRLAEALPQVSTWYMSYMMFALTGLAVVLLRPYQMGIDLAYRRWQWKMPDRQFYVDLPEPFGTMASRWTLHLAITVVYCSMDPVILLLAAVVFCCALGVYKYEVLCVYRETYDTGGLWVPVAAYNMQLILGIYQVTMLGVLRGHLEEGFYALAVSLCIGGAIVANWRFHTYAEVAYNYRYLPRDLDASQFEPKDAKKVVIGSYAASAVTAVLKWQGTDLQAQPPAAADADADAATSSACAADPLEPSPAAPVFKGGGGGGGCGGGDAAGRSEAVAAG